MKGDDGVSSDKHKDLVSLLLAILKAELERRRYLEHLKNTGNLPPKTDEAIPEASAISPQLDEDEYALEDDIDFTEFVRNRLSGEQLKALMVDRELPDEYINKDNLTALLNYERMQLAWNLNLYDMSVMIYCTNLLIRYYCEDEERLNRWNEALENIRVTMRSIDESVKEAQVKFFLELFALNFPEKMNDEQFVQGETEKFRVLLETGLPAKEAEEAQHNPTSTETEEVVFEIPAATERLSERESQPPTPKKKHRAKILKISAVCVVVLLSLQIISSATMGVNFFYLTRNTFFVLIGGGVQQGDVGFVGFRSREYNTIEEFEAAEDIRILVPTWLPNDSEIIFITYSYMYGKSGRIDIEYDDGITFLTIELNAIIPDISSVKLYAEIYSYNEVTFYVLRGSGIILWEYSGDFYNLALGFDTNGYVESIIENIK